MICYPDMQLLQVILVISVTTIVIIFNYTDTMGRSPFPHIGNKNPLSCFGIKLPDVMLLF